MHQDGDINNAERRMYLYNTSTPRLLDAKISSLAYRYCSVATLMMHERLKVSSGGLTAAYIRKPNIHQITRF